MNSDDSDSIKVATEATLNYESTANREYYGLARLICWLAIAHGVSSAGYFAMWYLPTAGPPSAFSPVQIYSVIMDIGLTLCGVLGLLGVRRSNLGIAATAVLSVAGSWIGAWMDAKSNGFGDNITIADIILNTFQFSTVRLFLVVCVMREPIVRYFSIPMNAA